MPGLDVQLDAVLKEATNSGKLLGLSYVVIGPGGMYAVLVTHGCLRWDELITPIAKILYSGAHGWRNHAKDVPMTLATAGWMASMTKLMTSIAVLQIIEKGLVGLDDNLAEVIPDLRAEVLVGFDEPTAAPVTRKSHNKITLRYARAE
jgi:CubicO group peptidase (beta-lactamase class C family)